MTPKILIVDDKEDNRFVLVDALEDEGYQLREAADGIAALEAVHEEPPDVILLDIMMPRMDGIECCRRLKADEKTRHIPVILVTALGEDEHVIRGLGAGATDYVAKPFAGPVVRARIGAALRSKLAHDELEERNREIRQLVSVLEQKNNRLAEMTDTAHRFVDNVAHEFRTPLSVIKEFASIIEDGLGGPVSDKQAEYLEFIGSATRDLAQMVDDFLDSSKLKACTLRVDRRPCGVTDILDTVRPMLNARAAQKCITFVEDLDGGVPEIFADVEKASRVLLNLATNAIKFSPEGSEIRIWARPTNDGGAEIGITDQGPGLSPEDVRTVFQRFKQVGDVERASTKGFGLGLNIAKELIWLNLGTVNVASEPGAGSTFSFTLPPCRPETVLQRYFERLRELDEPPIKMTVLRARSSDPAEDGDAVRGRLVAACHPTDIVLAASGDGSAVLVGSTTEPKRWIKRLQEAARSGGDPSAPPAAVDVTCVGSWSFRRQDEIAACVLDQLRESRACA